jgi:hypothetical protein
MDLITTYVVPYADGIAVTALAYVLSPTQTKARNAAIIGLAHFLLHPLSVPAKEAAESQEKFTLPRSNMRSHQ